MDQGDRGSNNRDEGSKQPENDDPQPPQGIIPLNRLAMAMQDQERAFPSLESIESESESDEDSDNNYNREDYEFFESVGFESELGFLEEQYSDDDDEMDEDDDDDDGIDVDELTYEELIALGEFIGVEERGLSSKEISNCLRPFVSKSTSVRESNNSVVDRCVICQVEYEEGEDLVALHCQHSYHSECITKWLQIKKCCPICASEVSSASSTVKNNINNNKDL